MLQTHTVPGFRLGPDLPNGCIDACCDVFNRRPRPPEKAPPVVAVSSSLDGGISGASEDVSGAGGGGGSAMEDFGATAGGKEGEGCYIDT